MYDKGIAVVAITHRGVETALKIQKALDMASLNSTVYAPKKYSQNGIIVLDKKLADFLKEVYSKVDAVVAVMATGIIIRSVAPLLESKLTDPAVVGVDASGKFAISLLSGHLGGANDLAHAIAKGINAIPVITTASDVMGKQSVDDLAKNLHLTIQNPDSLVAVNSAIVNGDRMVLVLVGDAKIPPNAIGFYDVRTAKNGTEALDVINNFDAGVIITHEPLTITKFVKPFTILRTRYVVVGLGARKESSMDSIIEAIDAALEKVHVPLARVHAFATVDIKRTSKPMVDAVARLGAPLEFLSVDALRSVTYTDLSPDSAMVQEKIGIGGVCERAALLGSGTKIKVNPKENQAKRSNSGDSRGRVSVVGIGPGSLEHLTPKARSEIESADVVVGYGTYIKLIQQIIKKEAEVFSGTMGKEVERAQIAVDKAKEGKQVVMVSSGDPGVYGMAGIVLEVAAKDKSPVQVEIVPGVTAATAASAILGAPLVSDFAVISLSDLLTPWEKIERRLEAASSADMSIVLYNPQSQGRIEPLANAYEIMMKHIKPDTPVGIVRQAGRGGQNFTVTTLKNMLNEEIDMVTTIVVGNSATKVVNGKMVTARGYDL